MAGAQARAAELQAAKSAAMRQRAHREIEEHILPPESAPVSLTEFARNPSLNKNKGIKAFRPLNDSDFESTSSHMDLQVAVSDGSSVEGLQPDTATPAPVAPRAMLNHSDSYMSKLTPSRARAPTFTPLIKEAISSTKVPDTPICTISTPPYLHTTKNAVGHVFGPDDLSPMKHETKFTEIRQHYGQLQPFRTHPKHFPMPFMPEVEVFTPPHAHRQGLHIQYPEMASCFVHDSYSHCRPHIQHYPPENTAPVTGYGAGQFRTDSTQMFADDLANHQNRLLQQPRTGALLQADAPQPYDRNIKMQSFVAAQQAMAKKGKTVLHNPDLYKSPQVKILTPKSGTSIVASPSGYQSYLSDVSSGPESDCAAGTKRRATRLDDKEAILRAILRRSENQYGPHQSESIKRDTAMPGTFPTEYRSEDWCTLRTITHREREKMLDSVKKIAAEASPCADRPFSSTSTGSVKPGKSLVKLSAEKSSRQAALEQVVDEHRKRTDQSANFGIIGRPIAKEKSDLGSRGALKVVARIMTTLYDTTNDREPNGNYKKHTVAPRHAIDANGTRNSLFSDHGLSVTRPASG